jgi:hypothetical protein
MAKVKIVARNIEFIAGLKCTNQKLRAFSGRRKSFNNKDIKIARS